jgi:S-adenosyl methyltransferase
MDARECLDHGREAGRHTGNAMIDYRQVRLTGDGVPWYLDASVPNVARVYDFLLGGKDNYAVDREAGKELVRLVPDALTACYNNRQFLKRVVRFLAGEAGIRQFIDIGPGLPTRGSVHEVAQDIRADARILYVDYDPVVVSHARALLAHDPTAVAINRDLREPGQILTHPALHALMDSSEPVAVLLVAVLHFLRDDDKPYEVVEEIKAAVPAGSYLVVSHVTADDIAADVAQDVNELYERTTAPGAARTRSEIARFFEGLEMVEPGLVNVSEWRSEVKLPGSERIIFYAGAARKRGKP